MKRIFKRGLFGVMILVLGMSCLWCILKEEKPKHERIEITKTKVVSENKKEDKKGNIKTKSSIKQDEAQTVDELSNRDKKKNISEFKKEMITNGLYINLNGTLELANEKNIKDIENRIKNPVIQNIEKDGEIIIVLSDSKEQVEGDK